MTISVEWTEGNALVLRMDDGENRFTWAAVEAWNKALDTVAEGDYSAEPCALITTGTGKFFSNGLDLDSLTKDPARSEEYLKSVMEIFARLLELPFPTVAAINGHAFAAGAMLAVAHDQLIMRGDRGWLCLPEIDLGLPFMAGMNALLKARLPGPIAHEAMLTGRRYVAPELLAAGVIQQAVPEDEVLPVALAEGRRRAAHSGKTLQTIRAGLYGDVIKTLRGPLGASL
ncbi:enoyl-CoA hydratase/isomerase family protein [Actinocorallia lasiicapitis]